MRSCAEVTAPAKVNLLLRVLTKRLDGYHEVETLFQAVDLADQVRVEWGGGAVELVVEGAELGAEEDNLAHRAASDLLAEARIDHGVRIELIKRIPVGAGLGGGSSDAAAVLKCLAALTGIAQRDERLLRIAGRLGSDVPFFLGTSPLALGRGRGEILEPLEPLPEAHLVIVSPPVPVSTRWAYHALDEIGLRGTHLVGPALEFGTASWQEVARRAHNDFQGIVAAAHPEVARSLAALEVAGAEAAIMSGSGSSSFGIFRDRGSAERAAERLTAELGWRCFPVRSLSSLPAPRLA